MTIPAQSPINTARLVLRLAEPIEDAQDVYEFLALPSVRQYTSRPAPTHIDQVIAWIRERAYGPHIYNFAVMLPSVPSSNPGQGAVARGKVIGILGSAGFPEVGYMFNPAYGGQGYATEALRACLPALFDMMPSAFPSASSATAFPSGSVSESDSAFLPDGAEEVKNAPQTFDFALAHVDVDNAASINLLERCGWTRGEVTKDAYTSAVSGLRDSVAYRIARPGLRLVDVYEQIRTVEEDTEIVPDLM